MKIWLVSLTIGKSLNDEDIRKIDISLIKDSVEFDDDLQAWVSTDGRGDTLVPKNIIVSSMGGNSSAKQGFETKPNEEELKNIEENMVREIKKAVRHDKENFLGSIDFMFPE